ncbi:hypothetical protein C8Q79DRAFT_1009242 [Trametes meyenii]|nr:hypothetical protein C8Q79DRAFT_1009242 [Trametes meyenii]
MVSPNPRSASTQTSSRSAPRAPTQPCDPADDPFFFVPDPRTLKTPQLLSPFRLPEEAGRTKLSKPAPCSPTKRRRGLSSNLSRSGRRRHTARSDCCTTTFPRPITSFDDLPWISALTIEPDYTDPWDIADLSLLHHSWQEIVEADGPGPVRRRKTPLRSNPLLQPSPKSSRPHSPIPFPFAHPDEMPQTPPPRLFADPSEVVFQGLHPLIFSPDLERSSGPVDIGASL